MDLRDRLKELDRLLQYIENEDKTVVHEYHIKARLYIKAAFPPDYRKRIGQSCVEIATVCTWIRRFLSVFECSPDSDKGRKYRETLGRDWRTILLRNSAKNLREAIDLALKMY